MLTQPEPANVSADVEAPVVSATNRLGAATAKADVLIEALPWITRFSGSTMVFKYGGNAMVSDELQRAFAADMVFLRHVGIHPVVVHGGGPQINTMLDRMGIESQFQGGLRVTSPEAVEVIRMVLTGQVQRDLVGLMNATGSYAMGLSGEDAALLAAVRRGTVVDGRDIDLGHVGEVVSVNPAPLHRLIADGMIPVVSSIAPEVDHQSQPTGEILNVNADAAAASVAVALKAQKLVMLTDVEGLYADWPQRDSLIDCVTASELRKLLPGLESGMIPKMEAALAAVNGGVGQAAVVDGREPHAVLQEIFTDSGTRVLPDAPHALRASDGWASRVDVSGAEGHHHD